MKRFLPFLLIAFLLPACSMTDLLRKVGMASNAVDMYAEETLAAKRAYRSKIRETTFAAVNNMVAQQRYQEAIDFLKANKPYFGQVLLDAEEIKQKIRSLKNND